MKRFQAMFLLFAIFLFANALSFKSFAFDYHGYFRAGFGRNSKGGKMDCYKNLGAFGPEFRFGNECSIYSELSLEHGFQIEKGSKGQFLTGLRFALSRNGNESWETDGGVALTEAYVEAQNLPGFDWNYWVGKRFYRWGDVYLLDWYPVNFSGMGAGLYQIQTPSRWGFATLVQADESVSTEIGSPEKISLHARLDQWKWDETKGVDLWMTLAQSEAHVKSGVAQRSTQGLMIAGKLHQAVSLGNLEYALIFGQGNLSQLALWGVSSQDCSDESSASCTVQNSRRVRTYFAANLKFSTRLVAQTVLAYDDYKAGNKPESSETWSAVGVQPVYYFSDHFQMTGVLGHSIVQQTLAEDRTLTRFAVGPQLSMGRDFWARPVLRAFVSYNLWNDANKANFAGSIPATANENSGWGLGFQTEVWF